MDDEVGPKNGRTCWMMATCFTITTMWHPRKSLDDVTHFHKLCAIQSTIGLVRYDHSNETVDNYLNVHTDARYHHTAHPSSENVVEAVASSTRSRFSPCEAKKAVTLQILVRQLPLFQCGVAPIFVRSANTKGVDVARPKTFTFSS